jgi:deoxyribose-phosphate aldolase
MSDLAKSLEYTILKPDTTATDVRRLCEEAQEYGLGGVCIPPLYVRDARRVFGESGPVKVVTVVAFPMGYSAIPAKSEEIKRAIDEGADEVDVVANIAALKSGNWNHVQNDVDSMARATHMRGRVLKLILECGLLTEEEIERLCRIAMDSRIDFVKTGTGFHGFPATVEMVSMLRRLTPPEMRIKAAGGIRTAAAARALLDAGADRIGTSAALDILGPVTVKNSKA